MPIPHPAARGRALPACLLTLACGFALPALAQERPLTYGVSQAFRHDSNLYRTSTEEPRVSDWRSITSLNAGYQREFGLQRAFANAQVGLHRFNETTALNHTSYALNLGMDWRAVERWSGTLRYGVEQGLGDYSRPELGNLLERNLERSQVLAATVRFGVSEVMALEGGLEHRRVDYSAQAARTGEFDQNVAQLGVRYGLSGALQLGAGVRLSESDYPRGREVEPGVFVANQVDRKDIDLTAQWAPTAISTVRARLSRTRETNSPAVEFDFSGITWGLGWAYQPTARLGFDFAMDRDTGTELRFTDFVAGEPTTDPTQVQLRGLTTAYHARVRYELTSTVDLTGSYTRRRGTVNASTGESGRDTTSIVGFGVQYAATRTISVGCSIARESRSSDTPLSYPYRATVAGCLVQAQFP